METKHLKSPLLSSIQVKGLWGAKDIVWDNLDPQVNILVGSNGSGKSTLIKKRTSLFLHSPIAKKR